MQAAAKTVVNYPASQVTAVSNSSPQRDFITRAAQHRGLDNAEVNNGQEWFVGHYLFSRRQVESPA